MKKIKKTERVQCDFCDGVARFDTPTTYGPWANVCLGHMASVGIKTSVTTEFVYV